MAKVIQHEIEQGEDLASIAFRYVAGPEEIWEHPDNSKLRDTCVPEALPPGGSLRVPVKLYETDQHHKISVSRFSVLTVQLLDALERPLKDFPCRLQVGDREEALVTDSSGRLTVKVPLNAASGWLFIGDEDEAPTELLFRQLDPVAQVTGAQARLNNLGFNCGPIDGEIGPRTEAAVAEFQRSQGLEDTGSFDAQTLEKLSETHQAEG